MDRAEDEGAEEGSKGVREPIKRIIPGAVLEKGLMVLVDHPDRREHEGDDQEKLPARRSGPVVEGGREETSASEEVSEVKDLIEMGDLKEEESSGGVEFVPVREEVQGDEPDHEGGPPEGWMMFEGRSRHPEKTLSGQSWSPLRRISSSMRSASHCFIID